MWKSTKEYEEQMVSSCTIQQILIGILVFVFGIIACATAHAWKLVILIEIIPLYFFGRAVYLWWCERHDRLTAVRALVVAEDTVVNMFGQTQITYRLVPIDETGEYINDKGALDFYITISPTKGKKRKNEVLLKGSAYAFLFRKNEKDLNESTLLAKTILASAESMAADNENAEPDTESIVLDPATEDIELTETGTETKPKLVEFAQLPKNNNR